MNERRCPEQLRRLTVKRYLLAVCSLSFSCRLPLARNRTFPDLREDAMSSSRTLRTVMMMAACGLLTIGGRIDPAVAWQVSFGNASTARLNYIADVAGEVGFDPLSGDVFAIAMTD